MVHVFEVYTDVVFCCHIVSNVVIYHQSKQTVEQCQIDFLIYFIQTRLQ